MTHTLGKCDLHDEDNKKHAKGIKDISRRFPPCEITWNKQKGGNTEYYLQIGKSSPGSMKNAGKQCSKGKLLVQPNSRSGDKAVHKPRFADEEKRMIKELISLATDSFCSKPNSSAVTRNGSKEKRLPPAAAKLKPLAKHPKQPAPSHDLAQSPMVADKQIVQDLIRAG
jgi:hypothetical protein